MKVKWTFEFGNSLMIAPPFFWASFILHTGQLDLNENGNETISDPTFDRSLPQHFYPSHDNLIPSCVAGGIAGAVEATVLYPTEFVKTQLQLQSSQSTTTVSLWPEIVEGWSSVVQKLYRGPIDCARTIVRDRGVLGLYKGLSTLVIGNPLVLQLPSFRTFSLQQEHLPRLRFDSTRSVRTLNSFEMKTVNWVRWVDYWVRLLEWVPFVHWCRSILLLLL